MGRHWENGVNSPITQQPCQYSLLTSFVAKAYQRKRSRKDPLVEVVADIDFSLKDYCSSLLIIKNFGIIF